MRGVKVEGCKVDGCDKPHYGLGYCNMHYTRVRKHGDPHIVLRPSHIVKHGTINEYKNYGCRCQACRDAWAKHHYEYIHRNPEQQRKHRDPGRLSHVEKSVRV